MSSCKLIHQTSGVDCNFKRPFNSVKDAMQWLNVKLVRNWSSEESLSFVFLCFFMCSVWAEGKGFWSLIFCSKISFNCIYFFQIPLLRETKCWHVSLCHPTVSSISSWIVDLDTVCSRSKMSLSVLYLADPHFKWLYRVITLALLQQIIKQPGLLVFPRATEKYASLSTGGSARALQQ